MTRVYWTEPQQQDIAVLAFKIRQNNTDISDVECVRMAMRSVLPEDKHRELKQFSIVSKWILPIWTRLTSGEVISTEPVSDIDREVQEPSRSLKEIAEERSSYPSAIKPTEHPDYTKVLASDPQRSVEDLSTEVLAQELVKRLLSAVDKSNLRSLIREEINAVLDRRLPGLLPPDDYKPEPRVKFDEERSVKAPTKHKVLVLGLLSKQQHLLKTQYGKYIDFYFLEGNEGQNRVRAQASHMEMTIKTHWIKGQVDFKGLPNVTNVSGMDSIRSVLNGQFKLTVK